MQLSNSHIAGLLMYVGYYTNLFTTILNSVLVDVCKLFDLLQLHSMT